MSTDTAVVKGGTQVSRCACRRVCIAGAAAQGFSGSEAGRRAYEAAVTLAQSRMARPSQLDHCMLKIPWSKQKAKHRSMKSMKSMPSQRYEPRRSVCQPLNSNQTLAGELEVVIYKCIELPLERVRSETHSPGLKCSMAVDRSRAGFSAARGMKGTLKRSSSTAGEEPAGGTMISNPGWFSALILCRG